MATTKGKLRRFQNHEVTLDTGQCIQHYLLRQENDILQGRKISVNGH